MLHKYASVLLCTTTKLAQSTSQYYFVLQACTKQIPILLYYFLLQSLHKAHPNTTLLFSTTKLAQSTSQYYFVLQTLHRALPRTTWYTAHRWPLLFGMICIHRVIVIELKFYGVSHAHLSESVKMLNSLNQIAVFCCFFLGLATHIASYVSFFRSETTFNSETFGGAAATSSRSRQHR